MPREQEPTVARTTDAVRSGVGGVVVEALAGRSEWLRSEMLDFLEQR